MVFSFLMHTNSLDTIDLGVGVQSEGFEVEAIPGQETIIQEILSNQIIPKVKEIAAQTNKIRQAQREKLVLGYIPLVHKIVNYTATYVKPPLSRDDLVSAGTVGLVKAARDFDPDHNSQFKTYAYIRIRGAVIDELREWSFVPTHLKKEYHLAQKLIKEYKKDNGIEPTCKQLAEKMGITVGKVERLFIVARKKHFLRLYNEEGDAPGLGSVLTDKRSESPSGRLERREVLETLAGAINHLSEKQKSVVRSYYGKELTMKQISKKLKITESRVSQLHSAALIGMDEYFSRNGYEVEDLKGVLQRED